MFLGLSPGALHSLLTPYHIVYLITYQVTNVTCRTNIQLSVFVRLKVGVWPETKMGVEVELLLLPPTNSVTDIKNQKDNFILSCITFYIKPQRGKQNQKGCG